MSIYTGRDNKILDLFVWYVFVWESALFTFCKVCILVNLIQDMFIIFTGFHRKWVATTDDINIICVGHTVIKFFRGESISVWEKCSILNLKIC